MRSCGSLPRASEFGRVQAEIGEGHMRVAGHAHELDRLAVRRFGPQHHRDVDAARIIAGGGVFLAVALPHHLEQIAVFKGLQRLQIVDLLQAQYVGAGGRDGERRQLPHVVGMRDRAGLLEQPVFRLVLDREQRQRPVLMELVAKAGIIEPVHEVLDIERGDAQRHGATFARKRRQRQGRGGREGRRPLKRSRKSLKNRIVNLA